MKSTEISPEVTIGMAKTLAGKGPVFMVNLVRYRNQAIYGPGEDYPPCSGREAFFERHVPAVAEIAAEIAPGASKMFFYGQIHGALCGPSDEQWDNVAIAEYADIEVVRTLIESVEYKQRVEPHRLAALEDWRFVAATSVVPGM